MARPVRLDVLAGGLAVALVELTFYLLRALFVTLPSGLTASRKRAGSAKPAAPAPPVPDVWQLAARRAQQQMPPWWPGQHRRARGGGGDTA